MRSPPRTLPRMAKAEGVAPLMHWKVGRTDDGGREMELPAVVQQSLKASYCATAARNTLLFREMDRILAALAEADTCPAKSPTEGNGELG